MISPDEIRTVAVVGAGTMGEGIAQVFATAGYTTKLFDIDEERTQKSLTRILKNLEAAVTGGKMLPDQRLIIGRNLVVCARWDELVADVIVEAVVEKLEVKQDLFRKLEAINKGKAILVTNTSSLSVDKIASSLQNPASCVGIHFFNPAQHMKLVEVIAGLATPAELVDSMVALSKKIGKTPIRVKDSPGFVVNRVARHFYVESLRILEENESDVQGIDKLLKSAGFRMGPFELMDLIGIDTNYSVTESLHREFYPNPKFMPSDLQKQKITAGHLGRKTGKGFYDYAKN